MPILLPQPDLPPGVLLLFLTVAVLGSLSLFYAAVPFEIHCTIIVQNICCSCIGFIIFPHPVGIRLGYALWYPTLWKHFTSLPYKTQKWPCDLLWPRTCVTLRWKLKTDLSSLSSQNVPDRGCSISLGPITKVTRSRTIGWTWWVRRNKLML